MTSLAAAALDRFPPVRGHLDAATSGVPPLSAIAAVRAAVDAWAAGELDGPGFDRAVDRSRAAFAQLVGAAPADVACGANVSVFAGLIAAAVPAGGEILCAAGDFTSVLFPMLVQATRGVRVREVELDVLAEAIGAATSLVAVSAVQSADGRVVDLDALATAAAHHDAEVFLDVTQATGWLPIDATRFTYVCGGAYKWLLSPRGTAFMAVRPDATERVAPHTAGWYAAQEPWATCYGGPLRLPRTAKRFDVSPAWSCWAGTAPAIELICELGVAAIGAYDLALAGRLRDGLGLAPAASAIVITQRADAAERLQRAGIRASVRAGRVRMSCHPPATMADVDRALEALTC
ncbi:MAG: aminotransferase class V-fold PLP-dependent enzyme [Actinomycetota bacterium]|nr:aminotransferase class V-fold PLP-dependent enzyme [Actinomycetota bacterium]